MLLINSFQSTGPEDVSLENVPLQIHVYQLNEAEEDQPLVTSTSAAA
jgi:hypothetical protein